MFFLVLDWANAFDSINVEALIRALSCFGVPAKMLRILEHIYQDRSFCVTSGGERSTRREQHSGISQGCPLSPFLFVMMMSALVKDAVANFLAHLQEIFGKDSLDAYLC